MALRNPHPKSPCVGEERRAGLGQTLPAGSPIVGSRTSPVQIDDAVNNYIRLGRRAACRDRRHLRRRERANLDQLCHLRDCVSALTSRHLRPVARVDQLQCESNRIYTCVPPTKLMEFPALVVSSEKTVQPVFGLGFHSFAVKDVDHDAQWLALFHEVQQPGAHAPNCD